MKFYEDILKTWMMLELERFEHLKKGISSGANTRVQNFKKKLTEKCNEYLTRGKIYDSNNVLVKDRRTIEAVMRSVEFYLNEINGSYKFGNPPKFNTNFNDVIEQLKIDNDGEIKKMEASSGRAALEKQKTDKENELSLLKSELAAKETEITDKESKKTEVFNDYDRFQNSGVFRDPNLIDILDKHLTKLNISVPVRDIFSDIDVLINTLKPVPPEYLFQNHWQPQQYKELKNLYGEYKKINEEFIQLNKDKSKIQDGINKTIAEIKRITGILSTLP